METKTKKIISFIFINMLFIIAYQKKNMLFIIEKLEHKIVRYIILLILMLFSW